MWESRTQYRIRTLKNSIRWAEEEGEQAAKRLLESWKQYFEDTLEVGTDKALDALLEREGYCKGCGKRPADCRCHKDPVHIGMVASGKYIGPLYSVGPRFGRSVTMGKIQEYVDNIEMHLYAAKWERQYEDTF